jgi:hypothetical protein
VHELPSSSTHESSVDHADDKLNTIPSRKPLSGKVYDHQAMEKTGVDKLSADVADGWSTGV